MPWAIITPLNLLYGLVAAIVFGVDLQYPLVITLSYAL